MINTNVEKQPQNTQDQQGDSNIKNSNPKDKPTAQIDNTPPHQPNNTDNPQSTINTSLGIDFNKRDGPDKDGYSIIYISLIFILFTFLTYFFTSHVTRDIQFESTQISTKFNQNRNEIHGNIFKIPIDLIYFDIPQNCQNRSQKTTKLAPETLSQSTEKLQNFFTTKFLPTLHQDIFTSTPLLTIEPRIIVESLQDCEKVSDYHRKIDKTDEIDDFFASFFENLPQNTLRYIMTPLPLGIKTAIPIDYFYSGKYTHSYAFYSGKDDVDIILHSLINTTPDNTPVYIESMFELLWTQIQPALLPALASDFDELSKNEKNNQNISFKKLANKPTQKFLHLAERFEKIFGISLQNYIDIQILPQTTYQLDLTLLQHSPMVIKNDGNIGRKNGFNFEQDAIQNSIKKTQIDQIDQIDQIGTFFQSKNTKAISSQIFFEAFETLQSALSPAITFTTSITTKKDLSIFAPTQYQLSHSNRVNANIQHDDNSNKIEFYTLDSSNVAQLATKYLNRWKPSTDFVPVSHTDDLLGPPKVINFVILDPGFARYNPSNNQQLNRDEVYLAITSTLDKFTKNSKSQPNDKKNVKDYIFDLTRSQTNTILIPQWGTVSILPPFSNHDINELYNGLGVYQQYDITQTIINELKAILNIGLNFNPQPHTTNNFENSPNNSPNNNSQNNINTLPNYSHPSQQIPLPVWQRELFYRSQSIRLLNQVSHTITSTLKLIENAPHMPFPPHISNMLTVAIELYQNAVDATQKPCFVSGTSEQKTANGLFDVFSSLSRANELSTAVFYHHELLPQLFFPIDQTLAIYAPFFAPILVPILTALFKIIADKIKKKKKE